VRAQAYAMGSLPYSQVSDPHGLSSLAVAIIRGSVGLNASEVTGSPCAQSGGPCPRSAAEVQSHGSHRGQAVGVAWLSLAIAVSIFFGICPSWTQNDARRNF
jgi:hypothetical protein